MSSDIQMETVVSIRFISKTPLSPAEQASLDALNFHAQDVAERLQGAFSLLATQMLDLKREHFTKER